ncbi:hypothetical protein A3F86_04055 [candidate division WOR-1 bacterium RIFCSPLOWO2_12_FULL_45_9]|uniref:Uncharacterized protein n=1 Tax=candidate division WOR-1 bacterium RIFCSPLOWO2_12_FULL_45_9 TaxID=1802568 RepID=A0A1F4RNV5_UNCSA|nr:MAG: hypothetical protein A3F86_04055 [candidate division WOR-1 bacterium RIFCSPLOWO2_12_FULL_45_9]
MRNLENIKEAIRKDPNNPQALKAVGRYYLEEGYYKLAKNHYSQAVQLCPRLLSEVMLDYEREIGKAPEKIGPRLSLAAFEVVQGNLDATILELEEALEVSPKNVEACNVLGRIFVKQGRIDETIALLERSLRQGVKDTTLTEILAGAYLEKGRIQEAIKFYEEILNYRPEDKHILRTLGELYTRTEDYNKAAQCFQSMFSNDPEVGREVVQRLEGLLRKLEGNILIREILADVYMRSLNPEAAIKKLLEIVRLDATRLADVIAKIKSVLKSYPNHPQATSALAESLRRQGNFSEAIECYHNLANSQPEFIEEAVRGYEEVLEFCPEQILARTYLAEAFLYKKQIKEALNQFEKMIEVDPSSAESVIRKCREIIKIHPQLLLARLVLGRACLAKGEVQRATIEAEGIIAIDKKFVAAYLLLGEAYFQLKLCRKAVKVLQDLLEMAPYDLRVIERYKEAKGKELDLEIEKMKGKLVEDPWKVALHLDLAKMYIEKGERDAAIRELQIALKDQARAPFAANLLGCVYRREGRFDLAAAQFNRALEFASSEIADFARTVRFNLGTSYEAQGIVHKALKTYEDILQEDIDFGNLKRRIKYLKAASLNSMRHKALLAVIPQPEKREIIAIWGRGAKTTRSGRKEDVSVSFGQKYNSSGFEYFMKGMHKAALEEFVSAAQLDSKFTVALNNLAVALANEGKFSEAKAKLQEAVHMEPNSVILRNNLGVICSLLGQIDLAQLELETAYGLDPQLSAVCLNLGDIYYLKHEIEKAMDLYKKVGSFDVLTEIAEQRLIHRVLT